MILEELQQRYGDYVAELVWQALTLEEFKRLEVEELVPYFELRAERTYQEYNSHLNAPPPEQGTSQDDYLAILRRRWQQAEEMAQLILTAEKDADDREFNAIEA